MKDMPFNIKSTFLFLILFTSLLAGCGLLPGSSANSINQQVTPTPTADVLGYQTAASQACIIADWSNMQTDKRQGDLLAWQPGSHNLAYVAPRPNTSWYIGMLSFADGPDYTNFTSLAPTILTIGDLTWSPDGQWLAFVAMRMDENVQTVMLVKPDGSGLTDLFPADAAKSDQTNSQKAVLQWRNANTLWVSTSCGEDCQQTIEVDARDGSRRSISSDERKNAEKALAREDIKYLDGLELQSHVLEYNEKEMPRGFSSPNWSPDESQVTYLDRRGLLWLLNVKDKTQHILDMGLRVVNETKWSPDGTLIAVRAEDRVFVFEIPCSK